jgi:hypothetical protein
MYFQELIDNFSLSIGLGMISHAEMQLGSMKLEQLFPKIIGES